MIEEDDLVRRARARVGTILKDRWTLDALLGLGGMAAVYSATHRNGSRVAIKWLHPELALDKKMRERFVREGYIANRVQHPGVVRILDDDTAEDGSLILFMELLDGETVEARTRRSDKRLDLGETLWIGHALLEVVAAAHDAGIIHRDLKPENLFITREGRLKVLDFGIARLRELSTRSGATGSQSSLGTPAFMPPEQARGRWQEVDARSDIWAIGATMFTLTTGRRVHEAATVNEQLLAAMTEPAPALTSVAPGVPADAALVIDRALAFKSDDRWPDARAMRAACANAYAAVTGRTIAEGVLSTGTDLDSTVRVGESLPAAEAPILISSPNLTTGRPVASVREQPLQQSPKRRWLGYVLRSAALVATVSIGAMALRAVRPTATPTPVVSRPVEDAPTPSVMASTNPGPIPADSGGAGLPGPAALPSAAPSPQPTSSPKRGAPGAVRPAPGPPRPGRAPARVEPAASDWHDMRH